MHECTSIIINSFHSFNEPFLINILLWRGEREALKQRMKTNRGRWGVVLSLSLCSLCKKNFPIFQTVVAAEIFIKTV